MNVSAAWQPQTLINASDIQSGFARSGCIDAPTAHEIMEVLARYHNAHARNVYAKLSPGPHCPPDEEILLAFCAIPCTPDEVQVLCRLLSNPGLGGRAPVGMPPGAPSGWKRDLASLISPRSGFVWVSPQPDPTDLDAFVNRATDFDCFGSVYRLKAPVRLALACLPEVPIQVFHQVIQA